jgi:hypothetical protein
VATPMNDPGLQQAQARLDATVTDLGYDWTTTVSREDGYTVVFTQGGRRVIRKGVDEAVLDDAVSKARMKLVQGAASALEAPEKGAR